MQATASDSFCPFQLLEKFRLAFECGTPRRQILKAVDRVLQSEFVDRYRSTDLWLLDVGAASSPISEPVIEERAGVADVESGDLR
jgi:hypothetical protein